MNTPTRQYAVSLLAKAQVLEERHYLLLEKPWMNEMQVLYDVLDRTTTRRNELTGLQAEIADAAMVLLRQSLGLVLQ